MRTTAVRERPRFTKISFVLTEQHQNDTPLGTGFISPGHTKGSDKNRFINKLLHIAEPPPNKKEPALIGMRDQCVTMKRKSNTNNESHPKCYINLRDQKDRNVLCELSDYLWHKINWDDPTVSWGALKNAHKSKQHQTASHWNIFTLWSNYILDTGEKCETHTPRSTPHVWTCF